MGAFPKVSSPPSTATGSAASPKQEVPVFGMIRESLNVRADVRDSAYMSLLQRRADDSQITSGSRTVWEQKIVPLDEKVEPEMVKQNQAAEMSSESAKRRRTD